LELLYLQIKDRSVTGARTLSSSCRISWPRVAWERSQGRCLDASHKAALRIVLRRIYLFRSSRL